MAIVLTVFAVLVREWLSRRFGPLTPFVTYYPVVMITSLLGGFYPALLATLLTACSAAYALAPYRQWRIDDPADRIALGVFVSMGALMGAVAGLYHRSRERERAAHGLAAERDRLAVTLRSIGDAVITTDGKGRVEIMNGVAETLTGWKMGEAAGRPVHEVFTLVDEESGKPAGSPVDRVLREGVPSQLGRHTALLSKDGKERPIADSAVPIRGENGRVSGVVLVFRDETEERQADRLLRESEARLRHLLEHLPQLVWTADQDGHLDYFSRRWREFTGQGEGLEDWLPALHPEDRERVVALWDEAVVHQKEFEVEHRLRRADGEFRWFLRRAFPLSERDGVTRRWIGTCTDIHDLKMSKEVLRQADSLKEDFLFMASHEFRTPLTALRLQAELIHRVLGKEVSEERIPRYLSGIDVQVDRLEELLRSLLDVSRINSGGFALELGEVDLSEIVGAVVERFRPEAERAGVEFRVRARSVRGRWDRVRLDQVVTNLVSNALKYGNGQPVDLETDERSGKALLLVRDKGIGIAPESRDRIFERFTREKGARPVKGLGLGLWIAKKLAVAHGGELSVESELGKGSTFTLSIPPRPSGLPSGEATGHRDAAR